MRIKLENIYKVIIDWYIVRILIVVFFLICYDVFLVELIDYVEIFIRLVFCGNNYIYLYSFELFFIIK